MIIPFAKKKAAELQCSFCKRPKSQCKSLIGNEMLTKFICDKCLETCHARLLEESSIHG